MFVATLICHAQTEVSDDKQEQVQREELYKLRDEIRRAYESQDYATTIELGKKGRELSDDKRLYQYYTLISSNLANALIKIEDTTTAISIFEESLEKAKIYQTVDAPEKERLEILISANIDLGNVLALTGKFEQAIEKYKEVLELTDDSDSVGLFIINYNIAECYLELGDPDAAFPYLIESNRLVDTLDIDVYSATAGLLSGKYYYRQGDYLRALEELDRSVDLAKSVDYVEVIIESYEYTINSHKALGNFEEALKVSEKLDEIQNRKFETDRIEAVQNARASFEVDEMKRTMEAEIRSSRLEATILWSSIALFIAIILVVILFIGFYRIKKLNKDLIEKNAVYLKEKDKSEKLLTARNALFSRISHELRTPMYGIVGISNILMEDNEIPETQMENVRSLKYSADYLLSLINNVLEMNKLNRSTNNSLVQEVFNIRELCHHAVESAKFISPDHTNNFQIEIDPKVSETYKGDAVKLMQVLINLLGNSNKFTKKGKVFLRIEHRSSKDKSDVLHFSVKDTGKGIEKHKLQDIFDEAKFINHNEENEGTGLGLPITKKILELQDSNPEITSQVGEGTTVHFNLQLEKAQVSDHSPSRPRINKQEDLRGKSILIVEDNKINQLVTRKIIESYKGKYEIAESGLKAVEMAKEKSYDLILMDINMPPGIDGFETTRRIRAFDESVPIVALTAVEQIEIETRMADSSMDDYLIKPFKAEDFLDKIINNLIKS
ncbi:hypothetical protein AAU57_13870 [Nonlabens sp. YIK11]|nr:hypothetical protein AAU57_13870 [Nonlabens sp. YIK11]